MKVLMLGWEFPPHISGGLGTACFGLTQGLSHHGVEVLFVVPRAFGDEDQRFVRVRGANQIPLRQVVGFERTRVRGGTAQRLERHGSAVTAETNVVGEALPDRSGGTGGTGGRGGPSRRVSKRTWRELLRVLEVPSLLRPYLTELGYLQVLREATGLSQDELVRRFASAPEDAREAVAELRAALLDGAGDAHVLDRAVHAERTLPFTGFYGPDLMAEVARFALVLGEVARRESFDVVHAHDWMTYPAGIVAARVAQKPLVVHMHASEYDRSGDNVNERVRAIEQMGLSAADRIVCVSHYTANVLRTRYQVDPDKLRVVHNAVTHRQQLESWHVEKSIPDPIVLFLGRVTFQKGPDYFLEAAARVVRFEPRVKFVMSGSGDMLPSMIERAARLGLARHAHFTGFLRGDDVERMYAMADIYVMPSVSEPFGISPLEAMALDVPVIVSRQSGVSEVLRNALKVDFWDVQDLANKILALLRYPALSRQLTEEGREEIAEMRWDYRGELVRRIYREVSA